MFLDLQNTPDFQTINLKSNDKTLFSRTDNGRIQTRKIAGQWWEFSASFIPMYQHEFMPVYAYIASHRGMHNPFSFTMPVWSDLSGCGDVIVVPPTGILTTDGAVTAGNTVIAVTGITGKLPTGDMIKFDNHDKVYMVVSSTEDLGDTNSITIMPELRNSINNTSEITYRDVPMKVRLKNDIQSFDLSSGNSSYFRYELNLMESL